MRALVSSTDAGKVFDLRCELREGLIDFLCRNYPESLPRQRSVSKPPADDVQHRRKLKSASPAQGKDHERGPKVPGIHAESEGDGAGS